MSDPKVLLIVDVQRDFLPGGALAVPNGDEVIEPLQDHALEADFIIASRDWHPKNHCSFVEQGGEWPVHCVQGTEGAELDIHILEIMDKVHNKGKNPDEEEYSAIDDTVEFNLKNVGVKTIQVGGLATEYCVRVTVLDALARGFKVEVLTDSIRGISEKKSEESLREMENAGAILLK